MPSLFPGNKRLMILFAFYVLFGGMYWIANSYQTNFEYNFWREAILDYALKALLTIPVWWLIFKVLKKSTPLLRLLAHMLLCPLYVIVWFILYRVVAQSIGLAYLQGYGAVWDIYIPTLFYFIQFGFFHAYEYWNNYQQQIFKEHEIIQSARIAEINTLKAQLEPHFLFNTLNSINATIAHDNEPARELIAKLAENFRYVISTGSKEYVTLKEDIDFIKNCLELEQIRFNDRLKVTYNVDANLMHHNVPPMILQPLIENAIKHGIAKSVEGGEIIISIFKVENNIVFDITNTMETAAIVDNKDTGIGLSNTKKRLAMLYGEELSLNIGKYRAQVTFKIPI
ncbi:histidine kinase [Flavobacterium sp. D11R37]|uniref:sensor histidine kinase n=1 Tax=Flavobacterium coralii TaxID=2838017 RepID=UPI001CA6A7A0|nr:histidine kinase [Flavobacterium coralii]MBY8963209.1 histidine kinase [Flavobacterium coralii]